MTQPNDQQGGDGQTEEAPATPTEVNVEGDAVVNNAPDGGGVDQAPDAPSENDN